MQPQLSYSSITLAPVQHVESVIWKDAHGNVTDLHVPIIYGSADRDWRGFSKAEQTAKRRAYSPIPEEEGKDGNEDQVARYMPSLVGRWLSIMAGSTDPMLLPKSDAPESVPEMRITRQATAFTIRVTRRTSHSWYRRVMRGLCGSGISSGIE